MDVKQLERIEPRRCEKVEVDVLGSPSLIVLTVSVHVKQHLNNRAQELCESRGGRPGLPVPNSPYGLCGRKATLKNGAQEQCYNEGGGGCPELPCA